MLVLVLVLVLVLLVLLVADANAETNTMPCSMGRPKQRQNDSQGDGAQPHADKASARSVRDSDVHPIPKALRRRDLPVGYNTTGSIVLCATDW